MNQRITFILNRPRNPRNIGAAARGMANFGFRELRVVKPYAPVWKETRSAVHAEGVVKKARKYETLEKALRGTHLVIGTSAGSRRRTGERWIDLNELIPLAAAAKKEKRYMAILFGSEKSGLSNKDLGHCHAIVRIPTAPDCPSMNLAQAVAVVAYAIRPEALKERTLAPPFPLPGAVSVDKVDRLLTHGLSAFEKAGLLNMWDPAQREERLRRAFTQWNLSAPDIAILHGLFRWVIKNASK